MDGDLIFDYKPSTEEVLRLAGFKSYYNLCDIHSLSAIRSLESNGYKFVWYSYKPGFRFSPIYLPKRDYEVL